MPQCMEVHFGVGALVRAAGCGMVNGCQRTLSRTHGRERMDGARVEVRFGVGESTTKTGRGKRGHLHLAQVQV